MMKSTSSTKGNTLAIVSTASALEALAQPSLSDQEAMQLVHDMWCHPGNDKMEQIFKARRGRGFPGGFITKLQISLCHLRCVEAHTLLSPFQPCKSGRRPACQSGCRQASASSSHVEKTQQRARDAKAGLCEYSDQAVAVPRMSAYFRERTGSGKSNHRFTDVPALLIIIRLQQSQLNVCTSARRSLYCSTSD
jgi:hypothetical protein